ncbi:MAG: Spy/CpxP family protein refolding chaperone [Muribaculaceae bacterium]|nr:Spy/CpxP family protein refolding chaperone [Muribaculaceae bacterium]
MRKKILTIAVVAMTIFASGSYAQSTTNANSGSVNIENVKGKKADRKGGNNNRYEGLTLTEAQKTKLQQLDEKYAAQRKEKAQARKDEKQRDKKDLYAARKSAKMEYLEEVKAIIGPDQYIVFLENSYVNGGNNQGKGKIQASRHGNKNLAHSKNAKVRKGDKRNNRKARGDKQNNQSASTNQTAQL